MVTCSGVCEVVCVVESWIIAVNLDGTFSFLLVPLRSLRDEPGQDGAPAL